MGKIYQFSEIEGGQIPKPEDFFEAKELVLSQLSYLADNGEIYGAKVFGSVAKGTPNERSDFDLLVITEGHQIPAKLKTVLQTIRDSTNVGIEPLVIPRQFAERGFHSINDLFLGHIRSVLSEGNVVGQDPVDIIKPFGLPTTKGYEQYLAEKLRRLREGLFPDTKIDSYRVLQRALEAPISVGRRTIQVLPHLGHPFQLTDDSKQEVVRNFREIFGGTSLIFGFETLLSEDKAYTLLLQRTLRGEIKREDYDEAVNSLADDCIPQAILWTSEVSLVFASFLEGNPNAQEGNIAMHRGKELFL